MSAWGVQPFQNDDSLDYRDGLIEQLARDIDASIQSKRLLVDDLFALHGRIEILYVIVKGCGNVWLEELLINSWIVIIKEVGVPGGNKMLIELKREVIKALEKFLKILN